MNSGIEKALLALDSVTGQMCSVNAFDAEKISDLPR